VSRFAGIAAGSGCNDAPAAVPEEDPADPDDDADAEVTGGIGADAAAW